jgi:hypothetical protein
VANYLELRGDTLVVLEESAARGVWSFSLDRVHRLETTVGDQQFYRPYMMRGAVIGGGAGALLGVIFASSLQPSDSTLRYSRVMTGLLGAGVGAGVGLLVGSRFRTERWTQVPLPRRTAFVPDPRGGFRLVFSY